MFDSKQDLINKMLKDGAKALILSAYTEEAKRWNDRILKILELQLANEEAIIDMEDIKFTYDMELAEIKDQLEKESKFNKFMLKLGIKSKTRKKALKLENNINTYIQKIKQAEEEGKILAARYSYELNNPPNIDRYELAMMNNKLFKPR